MSKIIMISGQQGAGKSTLADRLWDNFNNIDQPGSIFKVKFADPIYAAQEAIRDALSDFNIKFPEKDGTLLQLLGTEWGRKTLGMDVWVKALKKQIAYYEGVNPNAVIVIDDCRFPNELESFPEALRVRLKANENIRRERTNAWREATNHASEISLDGMDSLFELVLDTGELSKEQVFRKVMDLFDLKFGESLE